MISTLAEKIIEFNKNLHYTGDIPNDFRILNPYLDNPETLTVMQQFYNKFYHDDVSRKFIIGINPSRHGAGITGIPFTDTKRLEQVCGISMKSAYSHEISSVFLYDMIKEFGGAAEFYQKFYINSPFPLAIVRRTKEGKWINANYYDDKYLFDAVKPFMVNTLIKHINIGLDTKEVFVLGKKKRNLH
ncbi:uracil-DNA glycosylase family protein [Sphingobacterium sp. SG20118]|uniref:uracil-DNA glycosylase family protein n=1 Tax=Sphingobacterium sp. SG20118 TaxID=3367156 RepID=UPI0037DFBED9